MFGGCAGRSEFVGRATRGDDKPRGRGLGQRNMDVIFFCFYKARQNLWGRGGIFSKKT